MSTRWVKEPVMLAAPNRHASRETGEPAKQNASLFLYCPSFYGSFVLEVQPIGGEAGMRRFLASAGTAVSAADRIRTAILGRAGTISGCSPDSANVAFMMGPTEATTRSSDTA